MQVQLPAYDRKSLTPGIVHIGLGNFHRAHMAVYLDDLFALGHDHDWAILGAGVRAPDARMRDALKGQDCLSTVIELDPKAREWLADKGYDPAYGARPLKRVIQKEVQDPLAEMILAGTIKDGEKVEVTAGKQGLAFNGKLAAAA